MSRALTWEPNKENLHEQRNRHWSGNDQLLCRCDGRRRPGCCSKFRRGTDHALCRCIRTGWGAPHWWGCQKAGCDQSDQDHLFYQAVYGAPPRRGEHWDFRSALHGHEWRQWAGICTARRQDIYPAWDFGDGASKDEANRWRLSRWNHHAGRGHSSRIF